MQNANIFNLPENYTMKYCQCLLYPARERTRAQPSFLPFKSSKLTSSLLFISHPFSDCRSLPRPDVAPTFLRRRGDFNGKDCRLHSRKDVSLLSPFLPSSSTLSLEDEIPSSQSSNLAWVYAAIGYTLNSQPYDFLSPVELAL